MVSEVLKRWGDKGKGCQILSVTITQAPDNAVAFLPGTQVQALSYEHLIGPVTEGDAVRIEVSALDRSLGTGGQAMVSALLTRLPLDDSDEGRMVKCRYMPTQVTTIGEDERDDDFRQLMASGRALRTVPVIAADLHSALPAIITGMRAPLPHEQQDDVPLPRVAYIMTDGGALPAAYSQTAQRLRDEGWIDDIITTGQAWGGTLETVTVHNAILAAVDRGADMIVVCQGPGNLGTETPWGYSGVAVSHDLQAAALVGTTPMMCARASQADARERHQGLSHHTARIITDLLTVDCPMPLPKRRDDSDPFTHLLWEKAERACATSRARGHVSLEPVPCDGLDRALRQCPVTLRTMGRGLDADYLSFLTAACAGRYARNQWLA